MIMVKIKVRGVEHYYEWVKGDSAASSKPVMVFVHGWAGSDRYWESTARAIGDKFDCLLVPGALPLRDSKILVFKAGAVGNGTDREPGRGLLFTIGDLSFGVCRG